MPTSSTQAMKSRAPGRAMTSRSVQGVHFDVDPATRSLAGTFEYYGMMPATALPMMRPSTSDAGGGVPVGRTTNLRTGDVPVMDREQDNQLNMYSGSWNITPGAGAYPIERGRRCSTSHGERYVAVRCWSCQLTAVSVTPPPTVRHVYTTPSPTTTPPTTTTTTTYRNLPARLAHTGTSIGRSPRPCLSPVNPTCQGDGANNYVGWTRAPEHISPRPGPGAYDRDDNAVWTKNTSFAALNTQHERVQSRRGAWSGPGASSTPSAEPWHGHTPQLHREQTVAGQGAGRAHNLEAKINSLTWSIKAHGDKGRKHRMAFVGLEPKHKLVAQRAALIGELNRQRAAAGGAGVAVGGAGGGEGSRPGSKGSSRGRGDRETGTDSHGPSFPFANTDRRAVLKADKHSVCRADSYNLDRSVVRGLPRQEGTSRALPLGDSQVSDHRYCWASTTFKTKYILSKGYEFVSYMNVKFSLNHPIPITRLRTQGGRLDGRGTIAFKGKPSAKRTTSTHRALVDTGRRPFQSRPTTPSPGHATPEYTPPPSPLTGYRPSTGEVRSRRL